MDTVGASEESLSEPEDVDVVAAALAAGATAIEAGALVNVSDRTVRRWRHERDLDRRVAVYRREMIGGVAGTLTSTAVSAARVLAANVAVDDGDGGQLRAALAVLDRTLRYHAACELDARLGELEARLAELEGTEEEP